MFKIEPLNLEIDASTLQLNDMLFHEALREAPESMTRYHVENRNGQDFDIVYWDNSDDLENAAAYPKYIKPPYMPKYLYYDETDSDTLYLDFLRSFDAMMFEELNEYTIALTKVILEHTQMEIWCRDDRIFWFVESNARIHIVDEFPENRFNKTTFYIQEMLRSGLEDNQFNRLSSVYAFHNIFFLQWILNGRRVSQFRFITIPINESGGKRGGYHRNTEKSAQCVEINLIATTFKLVVHIQGAHHADVHIDQLGGKIEVALKVGGIDDIDNHIGHLLCQMVPDVKFFRRIAGKGVSAGQVGKVELVAEH